MSYSHADFKHCITTASTSRFWWRIVTDFFLALANSHLTFITRLCALRAIVPCPPSLRTLCALISCLRVRLHVTETKSHPGMKKFQFAREFHPRMKRVECHLGMKFDLKENPHWVWKHIIKFIIDMLKHQTITFLEK